MLAVVCSEVSLFIAARTAPVLALPLRLVYHGGRHDACGHGDDGVTQNHHEARQEASDDGDRRDVAITDGGEGHYRPVDARADVCELRIRPSSLDDEHQRADDGDQDEDEKEIDHDLLEAELDALHQEVPLIDEGEELEHAEDADQTEDSDDEEVACRREAGDEREVEGQRGEKVDDAEETEGVVLGTWRAVQTEDVLDGEEEGEDILQNGEHILETSHHGRFRLHEGDNETDHDGRHHGYIERFASLCVRIEHNII